MLKKILPMFLILIGTLNCSAQGEMNDQPSSPVLYDTTYNPDDEIFTVVENSPQYVGGDDARIKFLQENITYPKAARRAGIQGTVYITFVIEKSGRLNDIRILRGIGGGCDEESLRVVKAMPRWKAGMQRGKPVRVQFNMPIKYTISKEQKLTRAERRRL